MCGICGILSNSSRSSLQQREPVIHAMMDTLVHRGPDDHGTHLAEGMFFGFRRLSIIDIQGGSQPMHSSDGRYTLIFNGEIYNYVELRQSLIQRGTQFRTFSDTEVLLHMLITHGVEALKEVNGMFAFVFFDHATQDWMMARDPIGIKPLYYARPGEDEIVFASEIKAIIQHPELRVCVNQESLSEYLTFQFVLGDETLFENVLRVEPGQVIRGNRGVIRSMEKYFEMSFEVDDYHTEDYFIDRLRYLIEESVHLQTRSDVPLGTYLSGGIDSSYITSITADIIDEVRAFHGRFKEGIAYDESEYAHLVTDRVNAQLRIVEPTAEQFVEYMPKIIYMMDEPVAGPGVFPQYCVSKFARQEVTVVLGGQGGDEIFGGYARYLVAYLEQALKGSIYQTQEEGKHIITLESIVPNLPLLQKYQPLMQQFWAQGLFEPMDARYFHLIDRSPDIQSLLSDDAQHLLDRERIFARFQSIFNQPHTQSYINKMTHFDMKTLLPALLHVEDRVSMAVSLESRVPFIDPRVITLVAKMPPVLKFSDGRSKHILKQAARTRLPERVTYRMDKMGFPVPLKEWRAQEPVKGFIHDTLLSQKSRERGLFNPAAIKQLIESEQQFGRQLWGALCLELWYQAFID